MLAPDFLKERWKLLALYPLAVFQNRAPRSPPDLSFSQTPSLLMPWVRLIAWGPFGSLRTGCPQDARHWACYWDLVLTPHPLGEASGPQHPPC